MFTRRLAAVWIAFLISFAATQADQRPNIVFILADDLGINDLGCYGRMDHRTPHLDRLAREGMRFTSAYCAQPICSPSRAALLTGKAPARLRLTTYLPGRPNANSQRVLHPPMEKALPLEHKTVAEYLKEAGYASACIGKWHLGGKGFLPADQGFDFYHPGKAETTPSATEGGKGEYDLTAMASQFIERNRNTPFFLFLSHNTPHINYSARPELIGQHAAAFEPVYAALMETMDHSIGQLLKKIDALGLAEKTILVFTSDNGGLHVPEGRHQKITFNAPFRAGKGYLYEGGTRIPLIVRWPGKIKAGAVVDAPVVNTDWLPTFLDLLGIQTSQPFDGVSFAGLFLHGKNNSARSIYWHFPHYTNQGGRPSGAIRQGNRKFIEYYDTGEFELYDLANDIGERHNLASHFPAEVNRLSANLKNWRNQIGAQENLPNPDLDENLFRDLYVQVDPSKYEPEKADASRLQQMLEWRKSMNAVLK